MFEKLEDKAKKQLGWAIVNGESVRGIFAGDMTIGYLLCNLFTLGIYGHNHPLPKIIVATDKAVYAQCRNGSVLRIPNDTISSIKISRTGFVITSYLEIIAPGVDIVCPMKEKDFSSAWHSIVG